MKKTKVELTIQLESDAKRLDLFGPGDEHLRAVRAGCDVQVIARDGRITLRGKCQDVQKAAAVIDRMQKHLIKYGRLDEKDLAEFLSHGRGVAEMKKAAGTITVYSPKGVIEPFTRGQLHYVETISGNDLTFCTGPAGTGKTYLAVAMAVSMLKKKEIRKIVLARPAVEAGERLGFLPGDMQAKVNPYLRPLFDSLEDTMEFSQMRKLMDMDIIEVIPLAFMRGRTLNDAAIICDEAQNTSPSQMLMFLTRMGRGSKMIITGDVTQIDLEKGQRSGMLDAMDTLAGIDGIGLVRLNDSDIVRHNLVQNIVQAYDAKKKRRDEQV